MNPEYDPWDAIELSPEDTIDNYKNKPESERDPWDELDFGEGFWKSAFRTALQIPQGIAEGTAGGIATGLWSLLGQGAVLDPEEIDRIRDISEREGIPFDEEAYMQAAEQALKYIPTVANIGREIEEKTDLPLEPKTRVQKALRFGSMASKIAPKDYTFRGMNISLPKPILGTGVEATKEIIQELGVPEPFAELASFGVLKPTTAGAGKLSFTREKPSGLPERQFENIKESHTVSQSKLEQINEKLEKDFRSIADDIIRESPVGETAENLKNNAEFKKDSRQLLQEAQDIADVTSGNISSQLIKNEMADLASKKVKGYALNEYDNNYLKFMKEAEKNILPENISHGELVEQYRKNNASLSEYFEPGSSKALNRAKKDSLLDQNRAIANILEKSNPQLSTVFKEGNARWTRIMDAEAVDNFIDDIFSQKDVLLLFWKAS